MIGPHGDRPRPRKFLGTTAERVVRTSPVPVLVATNPPAGRPRRMLVPVDDSAITPVILEWVRDLAATFDADVTLLHVWSNAVYSHVASMSYATTKGEEAAQREINKELHDSAIQWLDKLARTRVTAERVAAKVTYGKPGDAALEAATAMSADLIVLGRRGSGLVAPALLGSTVERFSMARPVPCSSSSSHRNPIRTTDDCSGRSGAVGLRAARRRAEIGRAPNLGTPDASRKQPPTYLRPSARHLSSVGLSAEAACGVNG